MKYALLFLFFWNSAQAELCGSIEMSLDVGVQTALSEIESTLEKRDPSLLLGFNQARSRVKIVIASSLKEDFEDADKVSYFTQLTLSNLIACKVTDPEEIVKRALLAYRLVRATAGSDGKILELARTIFTVLIKELDPVGPDRGEPQNNGNPFVPLH